MGATQRGFYQLARDASVPLEPATSQSWLTNHGHLNPRLESGNIEAVELSAMFDALGGDKSALLGKRARALPSDFFHTELQCLVEIDETQHFSLDRLTTLELYPAEAQIWFDLDNYVELIGLWHPEADAYRRTKAASSGDFPGLGGRRRQRAYFDAVRDLLAPRFIGTPVLRVPAPECRAVLAFERFLSMIESIER